MKIIDLLNKIANGETPPKKIMFGANVYKYNEQLADYKDGNNIDLFDGVINTFMLNDEVEILEDKPSEEIRKLQSEIDILTNKVEHYYSEVVSFRDKTRYLKDELNKLNKEE